MAIDNNKECRTEINDVKTEPQGCRMCAGEDFISYFKRMTEWLKNMNFVEFANVLLNDYSVGGGYSTLGSIEIHTSHDEGYLEVYGRDVNMLSLCTKIKGEVFKVTFDAMYYKDRYNIIININTPVIGCTFRMNFCEKNIFSFSRENFSTIMALMGIVQIMEQEYKKYYRDE